MLAANPEKGEVSFVVGGETYVLKFSVDAICVVEGLIDDAWNQIAVVLASGRITYLRAVLWAGLREHHPAVTLKAAGEMIPLIEGGALDLVNRAIKAGLPKVGEVADDGKSDPRTAAAAGANSSAAGAN